MYSDTPRSAPLPPAMLAAVTLLQAYDQTSDALAVEQAVFDQRWQMVLDCLGCKRPPFSQGVLVDFRRRLIEHDMDRRLVERTVALAKETGDFGAAKLRVALDSAPLWGAGRVEDTFNLVAHAARLVISCAASLLDCSPQEVRRHAKLELLTERSIKASLDIDWSDEEQQKVALTRLLDEIGKLRCWLDAAIDEQDRGEVLLEALATLEQVIEQDIEPDPDGHGARLKDGTSRGRRISITDPDMRHGRKSKSRVINGYKRHVAIGMSSGLILAAAVWPANEREYLAMDEELRIDLASYGAVEELHIDRGYLAGNWVGDLVADGQRVVSKAWAPSPRQGRFSKTKFRIDIDAGTVTCPAGKQAQIGNRKAQFSRTICGPCELHEQCTKAAYRSVAIHDQEALLQRFRRAQSTSEGRQQQRKRVVVEHALAHITRRQGPRARYLGARKNLFDVRRTVVVENLHRLDKMLAA